MRIDTSRSYAWRFKGKTGSSGDIKEVGVQLIKRFGYQMLDYVVQLELDSQAHVLTLSVSTMALSSNPLIPPHAKTRSSIAAAKRKPLGWGTLVLATHPPEKAAFSSFRPRLVRRCGILAAEGVHSRTTPLSTVLLPPAVVGRRKIVSHEHGRSCEGRRHSKH